MTTLFVDKANAEGGISGCQVKFTGMEDGFDIPTCLRLYKEALQSDAYDVYFGPTNSGCMAGIPALTGAAGKFLISGIAADHQPFFSDCSQSACFQAPYYVAHASVSTFLEGRAVVTFAAQEGWKAPALMVPNYAYGQDVGNGFKQYYAQLVPDGKIADEQFPEFDEDDFTPFINAMISKNPDGILTAFFSSFLLPFMQQWKASGNDADIPVVSGLFSSTRRPASRAPTRSRRTGTATTAATRICWPRTRSRRSTSTSGPSSTGPSTRSSTRSRSRCCPPGRCSRRLVEQSGSLDPEAWKTLIESGEFGYDGPYNAGQDLRRPDQPHVRHVRRGREDRVQRGAGQGRATIPTPGSSPACTTRFRSRRRSS